MDYTKTSRFISHVTQLVTERDALRGELETLARIKRGTKTAEQSTRITQIRNRLKVLDRNIEGVADLSTFNRSELFHFLAAAVGDPNGNIWDVFQLRLNALDTLSYEGAGEKAIRHMLGLPMETSTDKADLPDDEEVKFTGDNIDLFRPGRMGRRMYVRLLKSLSDEMVSDEMLDGEVTAGKLYHSMDAELHVKFQTALAPQVVLADYSAIYLTTNVGYVKIVKADYERAFSLACVTQVSPKYRLKRSYLEAQLLATQDSANVAA
jgi:hypothetical protein